MKITGYNTNQRRRLGLAFLISLPWWFFGRLSLNDREIAPATWLWEYLGRLCHGPVCISGAAGEASALFLFALMFFLPAVFIAWLLQGATAVIKRTMTARETELELGAPYFVRLGLMLSAFALLLTGLSWLFLNQHSPMPCFLKPFWTYADFPAQTLFLKVFDYHRSESEFFLLVFLQWLLVGAGIGAYIVATRKTEASV
jgi:hypothetical protein